jgi:hypothetical protein
MDIRCKGSKISPKSGKRRNTLRIPLLPSAKDAHTDGNWIYGLPRWSKKSSVLYSKESPPHWVHALSPIWATSAKSA